MRITLVLLLTSSPLSYRLVLVNLIHQMTHSTANSRVAIEKRFARGRFLVPTKVHRIKVKELVATQFALPQVKIRLNGDPR